MLRPVSARSTNSKVDHGRSAEPTPFKPTKPSMQAFVLASLDLHPSPTLPVSFCICIHGLASDQCEQIPVSATCIRRLLVRSRESSNQQDLLRICFRRSRSPTSCATTHTLRAERPDCDIAIMILCFETTRLDDSEMTNLSGRGHQRCHNERGGRRRIERRTEPRIGGHCFSNFSPSTPATVCSITAYRFRDSGILTPLLISSVQSECTRSVNLLSMRDDFLRLS